MTSDLTDYAAITADGITAELASALADAEARIVAIETRNRANLSFHNTVAALDRVNGDLAEVSARTGFLTHVSADSDIRDAGQAADEALGKWSVALLGRDALAEVLFAFAETPDAAALEGEQRRLLDHWLRDLRRAGVNLPEDQRAELRTIRERMVEIGSTFQRNLAEYQDGIDLGPDDLSGLPESFVARLKPGTSPDTLRVSLDYPEYQPFVESSTRRDLREDLTRRNWSRAVQANRPLLEEMLGLRRRMASMLGYATWADYAIEERMAAAPARVFAMYDELRPSIEAAAALERVQLAEAAGVEGVADLRVWDMTFADAAVRRRDHGVDHEAISHYLPLDAVLEGLFDATSTAFGLTYREVDQPSVWHESVRLFEVHDAISDELLAHFYLDLFPRPGKFGHAAAFPLVVAREQIDGRRAVPATAMVANFTPASDSSPSLLRHTELVTLFHEFGHVLHMSLSLARYARFSGASTEWDFVEAPSQIMEHWGWSPEVLARFAQHHVSGEALPADLIDGLVASRYAGVGWFTARQMFLGILDLALHTATDEPDLEALTVQAHEVTGLPVPDGTFFLSSFAHIIGGYDAGYYGYLWASVIGDDMVGRFTEAGMLSPKVGREYRGDILEPNGSLDAEVMVEDFLGRPSNSDAFLRLRGLDR